MTLDGATTGSSPGRGMRAGLGGLVSALECHALRWRKGAHASPFRCGGAGARLGFDSRPAPVVNMVPTTVVPSANIHARRRRVGRAKTP